VLKDLLLPFVPEVRGLFFVFKAAIGQQRFASRLILITQRILVPGRALQAQQSALPSTGR
jgi:hypothetical protein